MHHYFMRPKIRVENNFYINAKYQSSVIFRFSTIAPKLVRKTGEEKKAIDLTLKEGDCHTVVEGIYLLSDKEIAVFIPFRDIN